VKEVKAAIMDVDRGFKTHERVTLDRGGGDWAENVEQLKTENDALRKAGGGQVAVGSGELTVDS
jgi:capsid protein